MGQLFISYRRTDAAGHAGRLYDRLCNWFDPEQLFYDQERMEAGEKFTERIEAEIRKARIVLLIIAPTWLDAENKKRLHQEDHRSVAAEAGEDSEVVR